MILSDWGDTKNPLGEIIRFCPRNLSAPNETWGTTNDDSIREDFSTFVRKENVFEKNIFVRDKAEKADCGPILSLPQAGSRYMDEHFQHWPRNISIHFSQKSSLRIFYYHRETHQL